MSACAKNVTFHFTLLHLLNIHPRTAIVLFHLTRHSHVYTSYRTPRYATYELFSFAHRKLSPLKFIVTHTRFNMNTNNVCGLVCHLRSSPQGTAHQIREKTKFSGTWNIKQYMCTYKSFFSLLLFHLTRSSYVRACFLAFWRIFDVTLFSLCFVSVRCWWVRTKHSFMMTSTRTFSFEFELCFSCCDNIDGDVVINSNVQAHWRHKICMNVYFMWLWITTALMFQCSFCIHTHTHSQHGERQSERKSENMAFHWLRLVCTIRINQDNAEMWLQWHMIHIISTHI